MKIRSRREIKREIWTVKKVLMSLLYTVLGLHAFTTTKKKKNFRITSSM